MKKKQKKYENLISTCQCAYCRNFWKAFSRAPDGVKSFFEQFAIDVSNPEEIIWFDSEDNEKIHYILYYSVKGDAFSEEGYELDFQGENSFVSVVVQYLEERPNFAMKPSGFCFEIFHIEIPWVLEEPVPKKGEKDVDSKNKKENVEMKLYFLMFVIITKCLFVTNVKRYVDVCN